MNSGDDKDTFKKISVVYDKKCYFFSFELKNKAIIRFVSKLKNRKKSKLNSGDDKDTFKKISVVYDKKCYFFSFELKNKAIIRFVLR